jgi:putative ABC transport system permease protein
MNVKESVVMALDSVRGNKLRTSLTLLSIAIGVFAIIGAGSLVTSIDGAVSKEMEGLGETTFLISKMPAVVTEDVWRKYSKRKPITYSQFQDIKRVMKNVEFVSASSQSGGVRVKYNGQSTDPDVGLVGGDDNYLRTSSITIKKGREFMPEDVSFNRNVAIIGNDIVVKLFPNVSPIGKKITVDNHAFEVIGTLDAKGATMGQSQDNFILIPINQYLRYYSDEWSQSLNISIRAKSKDELDATLQTALSEFRIIRNLKPWIENDFEINTNESISETFSSFTSYLSYFGIICGGIALIAAGVGIMNIMLVSVKERTREIGIRKAIGAKEKQILFQFIIETITLCQFGGIIGIVTGIGGAALLSSALGMPVVFPTNWVLFAIGVCTFMGLIFGAYPAWRAAKLDPIDALRYE